VRFSWRCTEANRWAVLSHWEAGRNWQAVEEEEGGERRGGGRSGGKEEVR